MVNTVRDYLTKGQIPLQENGISYPVKSKQDGEIYFIKGIEASNKSQDIILIIKNYTFPEPKPIKKKASLCLDDEVSDCVISGYREP
ncbi:MAG: hypothetical protein AABW67_04990 [Nanoarchaeota archaeon]